MISIDIDDREVAAAIKRLRDRAGDSGLRPCLAAIGEHLAETTKRRFATSTAPDGTRWKPTRKGNRPLVDTGQLAHTIRWQPITGGVAVGTDRFADLFENGAAVHQFGSRDGTIPARPFLGLSNDDRTTILAIVEAHLAEG